MKKATILKKDFVSRSDSEGFTGGGRGHVGGCKGLPSGRRNGGKKLLCGGREEGGTGAGEVADSKSGIDAGGAESERKRKKM